MTIKPKVCGKKMIYIPKKCEATSCDDSRACYGEVCCAKVGCDTTNG